MSARRLPKVVFMGTPAYATFVLDALLEAGYQVVGVYTQPDRPSGRGRSLAASFVKQQALERGLQLFQPPSLKRDEKARQELVLLAPELIVVAAYGLFLPPGILALPRLGCLNVHPSLLPRYRGPSPVASAILQGEATTGVTIMKVDEGMDSGPIVAQQATPIGHDETAEGLTNRLFQMGAALLVGLLPHWERGEIQARPQDHTQATVTRRLSREDGQIDWTLPADRIARQVRAYYPWPGSSTRWQGRQLKIIEASAREITPGLESPGQVVALSGDKYGIAAGQGILEVRRLQLEGGRSVSGREFAMGHQGFLGSIVST